MRSPCSATLLRRECGDVAPPLVPPLPRCATTCCVPMNTAHCCATKVMLDLIRARGAHRRACASQPNVDERPNWDCSRSTRPATSTRKPSGRDSSSPARALTTTWTISYESPSSQPDSRIALGRGAYAPTKMSQRQVRSPSRSTWSPEHRNWCWQATMPAASWGLRIEKYGG